MKRLEVYQPILTNEDLERIRQIGAGQGQPVLLDHDRHHLPGREGRGRHGARRSTCVCAEAEEAVRSKEYNIIILSDRAAGPGPHSDPVAARHLGRASSPDPAGPAHLGRPGRRDRRGARGASVRVLAGYGAEAINPYLAFETLEQLLPELDEKLDPEGGAEALHQGDRQGPAEGDVQDGHLDLPVLLRRADLRRRRPARSSFVQQVLHRHAHAGRGRRPAPDRARDRRAPPPGLRRRAGAGERARRRRRVRLPHPRRGAHVAARAWSPTCSTRCAATCPTSTARSPSRSTTSPSS